MAFVLSFSGGSFQQERTSPWSNRHLAGMNHCLLAGNTRIGFLSFRGLGGNTTFGYPYQAAGLSQWTWKNNCGDHYPYVYPNPSLIFIGNEIFPCILL